MTRWFYETCPTGQEIANTLSYEKLTNNFQTPWNKLNDLASTYIYLNASCFSNIFIIMMLHVLATFGLLVQSRGSQKFTMEPGQTVEPGQIVEPGQTNNLLIN